eukprot:scaffold373617_cov126-Cyclotella_meneghiniana.AAC.1
MSESALLLASNEAATVDEEEDDNMLHGSILDELTDFDKEQDTEDSGRKIPTEGVYDSDVDNDS